MYANIKNYDGLITKVGQCNLSCWISKKVIRRGTGVSDMCAEGLGKLAFHQICCQ